MERSELLRLLPPDVDEIVPFLSDGFLDLYDVLAEVLFFGDNDGEDLHVSKSESTSWDFADERLFWIKKKIDRYLATTATALRRYETECRAQARAGYEEDGRLAVPRARRAGPGDLAQGTLTVLRLPQALTEGAL
jgi:hypothetical protein